MNDSREGAKPRRNVEALSAMVVDYCCRLHVEVGPGLLINFGAPTFKEGVKRIAHHHQNFASSRLRVSLVLPTVLLPLRARAL